MDEKDETLNCYSIPSNYKVRGKFKKYYIRNIVEAAIATLLVVSVLWGTKFIWEVKLGACIIFGALTAVGFLNGIKNYSVSQFLIMYVKFLYTNRLYHYKPMEEIYGEADKDRAIREEANTDDLSPIERLKVRAKLKFGKTKKQSKKREESVRT